MKVYIGYLVLTESEYRRVSGVINYNLVSYDENNDRYHILFGQTNDKKLWNKFSMIHGKLKKRVVHMDEEDYHDFDIRYKLARIRMNKLQYGFKDKVNIPATLDEIFTVLNDEGDNGDGGHMTYMYDIASFASADPQIFNSKIYQALDNIWYVEDYYTLHGTDEEIDFYQYNRSYYNRARNFNEVVLLYMSYEGIINLDGLRMYLINEVNKNDKS